MPSWLGGVRLRDSGQPVVQFAIEIAQEGALHVSHIADEVETLPNLGRPLRIIRAAFADAVRQGFRRLLEPAGGAVLRFGLREQIERENEQGLYWIVGARHDGSRVPEDVRHDNPPRQFLQSSSAAANAPSRANETARDRSGPATAGRPARRR